MQDWLDRLRVDSFLQGDTPNQLRGVLGVVAGLDREAKDFSAKDVEDDRQVEPRTDDKVGR